MRDLLESRIGNGFLAAMVAATLGCGSSPTSPGPASEPESRTLTVVSGWDQAPVVGATVHLDGAAATTSSAGEFALPEKASSRMAIDIDAAGFLPHRTTRSAVPHSKVIALWPAGNDAEVAAIRAMTFYEDRQAGVDSLWRPEWFAYHLALLVEGNPRERSEIVAEWASEYREIEALIDLPLNVTFGPKGLTTDGFEEEIIVALDALDESCRDPRGFCSFWNSSLPYASRPYRLAANRPDVIRRVLANGLLKPNPLPGLLNSSNPATDLSLLERQTLRMVFLRPVGTIWPDTDPSR